MRSLKLGAVSILLAVSVAAPGVADGAAGGDAAHPPRAFSTILWGRYAMLNGFATLDVMEFVAVAPHRGGRIEHEVSALTLVPLAFQTVPGDDGDAHPSVMNFRTAYLGVAWMLSRRLSGQPLFGDTSADAGSLWRYLLFLPDSRLRVRLLGDLKLLLGTRTDLLLYRTDRTDRGVVFTPHVGLDLSGGDYDGNRHGGLSAAVGWRRWWNWDGDDRHGEMVLIFSLWGMPETP